MLSRHRQRTASTEGLRSPSPTDPFEDSDYVLSRPSSPDFSSSEREVDSPAAENENPFGDHNEISESNPFSDENEVNDEDKIGGKDESDEDDGDPTMVGQRNVAHAEESAEVEVLYANLDKLGGLTKKIQASLTRLETNGRVVKEAIGPVYNNTKASQTVIQNIDNVSAGIERMQKPMEGKAREEKIIRAGPGKVGIQEYLASLKRTDQALGNMNATNLRVNQQTVGDLNALLVHGTSELQILFHSTLKENVQPVEPLHYITKQLPFPTLPQDKLSILRSIESFLSSSAARDASYDQSESVTIRTYSGIRGPYLTGSLQNLATASISTARKKSPDENYRVDTNGIGTYATGLENIFLAEYQNITAVFSRADWGAAFEITCRKALAEFAKTLRELDSHIKLNITTDCFLAYEIIDIVTPLSLRLDEKTGELKSACVEALKPIRETAKSSLVELLEDVRKRIQNMQVLPADGAAIPLTTAIMTRLQTMILYPKPLYSIMTSLGDGNWYNPNAATASSTSITSGKSFDVGADGRQLLAHYISDTIENLLQNLDSKARILLKNKSILGIFLANNVAIIVGMIQSSDLASVLSASNSPAKWEAWRKRGHSAYLDSWKEACSALLDVQYTSRGARPPSGGQGMIDSAAVIKGLGSKEKDAIKEKFKTFNTTFDELSAKNKSMTMEKEVRSQLAREVAAMIEPLYGRFWDRYHEIDKGKGKYVKYDKGNLAAQLATLDK